MKRNTTIFLQLIIVALGICVFVLMLWFPNIEGRNVNSTLFQVYFNDPFLVYAYTASIAFFIGVYNLYKILGYIGQNKTYSEGTIKSIRTIKYCALALVVLVAAPLAYLFIVRPDDDIAGGVAMGLFLIVASTIVATTSTVFERRLQSVKI